MKELTSSLEKTTVLSDESKILIISSSIKINYHDKEIQYFLIITVVKINIKTHDTKYNVFSFNLSSNNWEKEIHEVICEMEKVLTRKERVECGTHVGYNLNKNHLIHEKLEKIKPFGTYRTRIVNIGSLLIRNRNYLSKSRRLL